METFFMKNIKRDIRALTKEDLINFFIKNSEKAFKGKQVYEWLWKKGAHSFDQMTNLSIDSRNLLKKSFDINHIEVDTCLLYTSPSPRDCRLSRMPSSA